MKNYIFFIVLVVVHVVAAKLLTKPESYCFSKDNEKHQLKHFGSKTAYQRVKGTNFAEHVIVPNCTPVKFWLLSRHGTRLPDRSTIRSFRSLKHLKSKVILNYAEQGNESVCTEDLQLIQNWVFHKNITERKSMHLTTQGWQDMKAMAEDFKEALPHLFDKYERSRFLFRHTDTSRTKESFRAFVEGLFGRGAYKKVDLTYPLGKDTLLAPFKYCSAYRNPGKTRECLVEYDAFKYSEAVTHTLESVSARLGFNTTMKYRKVKNLWEMCRYEAAWLVDKTSPWCAAFTMNDILVFEYLEDLNKEFWNGYSSELNENVACEAVQDMLNQLNSNEEPEVIAYFSHSPLIQLVAVALGIQRDNSLLSSAGFSKAHNRKWRTSKLDPFGANYAVVKYDCQNDEGDPTPKIRFFSNQHPIDFEGCRNGLCSLYDFTQFYGRYLNANCKRSFCSKQKL